jgi:cytoskeletal protein CcmA (bactofilin family)
MQPVEESTVIGKSVTIRGELAASEDLFLDGEFHGTLSLPTNRLTVGPNALILADLKVRDLVVFGKIEGNITASGRVELRQTAIVQGDIASGRLSIEEAASLKGRVEIVREGAPTQTLAPAAPGTAESEPSLFSEQKI